MSTSEPGEGSRLSPREARRETQRHLARSQILDAAETAFAAKGYQGASLRDIAERAEYSVGALYTMFESKEALFLAVVNRRGAQFLPGMEAVLGSDQAPLQQLHALADFQIGFFREHVAFARIVLRGSLIAPIGEPLPADDDIAARMTSSLTLQAELFRRGHLSGDLRTGAPTVLARLFSGIVSAYQSAEAWSTPEEEHLPLEHLHELLEAAFASPRSDS